MYGTVAVQDLVLGFPTIYSESGTRRNSGNCTEYALCVFGNLIERRRANAVDTFKELG